MEGVDAAVDAIACPSTNDDAPAPAPSSSSPTPPCEQSTSVALSSTTPKVPIKELAIYVERLPEDLIWTARGRRKLLRQLNLSSSDESQNDEKNYPKRSRGEIKRYGVKEEGQGQRSSSSSSDSSYDSDAVVEEMEERRKSRRKSALKAAEEKRKRRGKVNEEETRRSGRKAGSGVKYADDSDASEGGSGSESSHWSGRGHRKKGGGPKGRQKRDPEEGGNSSSPPSSDFENTAKSKAESRRRKKATKGKKGGFLNHADDMDEVENGFDLGDLELEEEDVANCSELSLPPSDNEAGDKVDEGDNEEGVENGEKKEDKEEKEENGEEVEGEEPEKPKSGGSSENEKEGEGQKARKGGYYNFKKWGDNKKKEAGGEGVENARKKRLEYILKRSEFYTRKLTSGGLAESPGKKEKKQTRGSRRRRRAADEADLYLMDGEEKDKSAPSIVFDSSPGYITGGVLRDYQVRGLNWMINLYENGINGILADEMGLGKTLQSISILGYLKLVKGLNIHAIVIVPKSTLTNWENEFRRFCPALRVVKIIGDANARMKVIKNQLKHLKKWDVLITSYEMVLAEKAILKKIHWGYLIIDEAHRIKNDQALLSKTVRTLKSRHRLLLTGTPLQNNLHELWALLNFLLPEAFSSADDFASWFDDADCLENEGLVARLHTILKPFLLRRLKSDVEKGLPPKTEIKVFVPLSKMQRECYKTLLLNQFQVLTNQGTLARKALSNVIMHLRKCCNHPYLFPGQEPGPPYTCEDHLYTNSGKMAVLDKLLTKLKEEGSRVLLFTSMARMLDIMEDYCFFRNIKYFRLDGQTDYEERQQMIDEYNAPGSETFLFMLTTRAGGLGINLATADCVVIYDSDWNPMVDLQAMDRAHRIGQTKAVRVFRLVTEDTVEEKIIQRAAIKLKLDRVVIQQGRTVDKSQNVLQSHDMLAWIRAGAALFDKDADAAPVPDQSIADILEASKTKSKKVDEAVDAIPESKLGQFTIDAEEKDFYDFEGQDFRSMRCAYLEKQQKEKASNHWGDDDELGVSGVRASKRKAMEFLTTKEEDAKAKAKKMTKRQMAIAAGVSVVDISDDDDDPVSSGDEGEGDALWMIEPEAMKDSEEEEEEEGGQENLDAIGAEMARRGGGKGSRGPYRKKGQLINPGEAAAGFASALMQTYGNQGRGQGQGQGLKIVSTGPDGKNRSLLRSFCTFLPGGQDIQCNVCSGVLVAKGNLAVFKDHFIAKHTVKLPTQQQHQQYVPRNYIPAPHRMPPYFPTSVSVLNNMEDEGLLRFGTFDASGRYVTCALCNFIISFFGDISKFRKHLAIHCPPPAATATNYGKSYQQFVPKPPPGPPQFVPNPLAIKGDDDDDDDDVSFIGVGRASGSAQASNSKLKPKASQAVPSLKLPTARPPLNFSISPSPRLLPPLAPPPLPSSEAEVDELSGSALRNYYKWIDGRKRIVCLECGLILDAYGNVFKFRTHLKTHIKPWIKSTPKSAPSSTITSGAYALTAGQSNGISIRPSGPSPASKRRKLDEKAKVTIELVPATTSRSPSPTPSEEELEADLALEAELPVSLDALNKLSVESLKRFCCFEGEAIVCLICDVKLAARGNISKFKRHLESHIPAEGSVKTPKASKSFQAAAQASGSSGRKSKPVPRAESEGESGSAIIMGEEISPEEMISSLVQYPSKVFKIPAGCTAEDMPSSEAHIREMSNDQLRKLCEFECPEAKSSSRIICLICNKRLEARGVLAKFRRHLYCHAPGVARSSISPRKSGSGPGSGPGAGSGSEDGLGDDIEILPDPQPDSSSNFSSPVALAVLATNGQLTLPPTVEEVNKMGSDGLKAFCRFQGKNILCLVCNNLLNAHGNISKFRRHLGAHIKKTEKRSYRSSNSSSSPVKSQNSSLSMRQQDYDEDEEDDDDDGDDSCVELEPSDPLAMDMDDDEFDFDISELPGSAKELSEMRNVDLKKFCKIELVNGSILCLVCNARLNAQGNIGNFRAHMFSCHISHSAQFPTPPTFGADDGDQSDDSSSSIEFLGVEQGSGGKTKAIAKPDKPPEEDEDEDSSFCEINEKLIETDVEEEGERNEKEIETEEEEKVEEERNEKEIETEIETESEEEGTPELPASAEGVDALSSNVLRSYFKQMGASAKYKMGCLVDNCGAEIKYNGNSMMLRRHLKEHIAENMKKAEAELENGEKKESEADGEGEQSEDDDIQMIS